MLPSAVAALLPTPGAAAGEKGRSYGQDPAVRREAGKQVELADIVCWELEGRSREHLLPTPAVNDMGASYTPETWDEWTAKMQAAHGNGNGHGKSLSIEAQRLGALCPKCSHPTHPGGVCQDASVMDACGCTDFEAQRLLPTPVCGDARGSRQSTAPNPRADNDTLSDVNHKGTWGDYAAAIARWETVLGRPAPAPTMTSAKGNPQLSPVFVEWMMGLPAGWVTDVPGITRNEALRALGNGVVPQQCGAALRLVLGAVAA